MRKPKCNVSNKLSFHAGSDMISLAGKRLSAPVWRIAGICVPSGQRVVRESLMAQLREELSR